MFLHSLILSSYFLKESDESNDRLEESCSCDLNSIDNTESDGSPSMIKSRSETLETPQSSEVISLDSRLSEKADTPTTALENRTETPTILEEANSEAISLPTTTQETSEILSIESSSDLYSEVRKNGSSSPESVIHETTKTGEGGEVGSLEHVNNVVVTVIEPPAVTDNSESEIPYAEDGVRKEVASPAKTGKEELVEDATVTAETETVAENKNSENQQETSSPEKLLLPSDVPEGNPVTETVESEIIAQETKDVEKEVKVEDPSEEATREDSKDAVITEEHTSSSPENKNEECAKEKENTKQEVVAKSEETVEAEKVEEPATVNVESTVREETSEEATEKIVSEVDASLPTLEESVAEVVTESSITQENVESVEEVKNEIPEVTRALQPSKVDEEENPSKEEKVEDPVEPKVEASENLEENKEATSTVVIDEEIIEAQNHEENDVKPIEEKSHEDTKVEVTEDTKTPEETGDGESNKELEESNDKVEKDVKTNNCSTSVVEETNDRRDQGENVAVPEETNKSDGDETQQQKTEEKDTIEKKDSEVCANSELSNGVCDLNSSKDDKSGVIINDNSRNENTTNDEHSRVPSNISNSDTSDNIKMTRDADAINDVTDVVNDSVCNSSNVQSTVHNETQVPNSKHQIPTISTVCDATKSLPDGVPHNVSNNAIERDDPVSSQNVTQEHVDVHRRSSLPNVNTDNLVDDSPSDQPPSLPIPLRKNSSPQKRPRSASTSTQVDPNHFGNFWYFYVRDTVPV